MRYALRRIVGRTPWSADGPLAGSSFAELADEASAADQGVRPTCLVVAMLLCVSVNAQVPGWRQTLMGFPAQPSSANVGDIQRFESNVRQASPYFATMTPGDYAANRALMRQMVSYLGAVDLMTRDPQTRAALSRAYYYLAALRWVYPQGAGGAQGTPAPPPPGKPGEPPFERSAPEIKDVAAADKATADELRTRYATSSASAARAWTNAEQIRISQESQGMTMNAQTATSVARLQLYLELAAGALRARDWTEAKENLEKTEYETEKVFRAVGR